jgi:tetratricopeptide (TPR) repeat protein
LIAPAGPLGRFAFAHALVAEAIGAQQPASRRAERHLKLADVLADRHETDGDVGASEVARHLRAAGPLTDGTHLASWELAAAREATAALAHAEAAAHLEAALAARPAGTDRAALLVELGDARDRAGLRAAAREAFKEAAKLARARHDPQRLARAALGHGGLAVVIAAPERQTTALLEEALAAVPRRERATTARLRSRLAVELYYLEPHRARELSERALADARASRDQAALAAALNARRVALWNPACVHERLAVDEEMLAAAESAGDREAILQARNWRVVDLWELGRTMRSVSRSTRTRTSPRASGCRTSAGTSPSGAPGSPSSPAAGARPAPSASARSCSATKPTTPMPRSWCTSSASTPSTSSGASPTSIATGSREARPTRPSPPPGWPGWR